MPFLSGLALGLSMILPIGPQNVFVLDQGLLGGVRRGLLAAATAGCCDTVLILAGAAGMSAVFGAARWLETLLLCLGAGFLLVLGAASLRRQTEDVAASVQPSRGSVVLTCVGVSWGNPHAILDTVVILGSAILAQRPGSRPLFAAGAITASWLFFALLALGGAWLEPRLTGAARLRVRRASGIIMLVFAAVLAREAVLSAG
jgi:L-lysine exporter family protein LysE/ArgO